MFTSRFAQNEEDNDRIMSLIQKSYAKSYSGFDYAKLICHPYFKQVEVKSIILFYERQLVGTISILHNKYGGILPSEHLLKYVCPNTIKGNVVEIGRLARVIDIELDNTVKSKILPVLLWLGACELINRKEEYFICSIQNSLFAYFTRFGFAPTLIDEGIQHEEAIEGKGDYLKYDTKFIYCNAKTCYDVLSKMGLSSYVEQIDIQLV